MKRQEMNGNGETSKSGKTPRSKSKATSTSTSTSKGTQTQTEMQNGEKTMLVKNPGTMADFASLSSNDKEMSSQNISDAASSPSEEIKMELSTIYTPINCT